MAEAGGSISNGVGLKLCHKICEQLEGSIEVESMLGYGSVFTFTMRVKPQTKVLSVIEEESYLSNESNEEI